MAKKDDNNGRKDIKIDYDKIDVKDIMHQIQNNTAAPQVDESGKKPETPPAVKEEKVSVEPDIPEPERIPFELTGKKKTLLKLMRPFAPLIKLLALPVYHELMETVHNLDYSNRRMDYLNKKIEQNLAKLSHELYTATDRLNHKIDEFNQGAHARLDLAFDRMSDLDRTMEYTKLLHSLCHNIVVELTKLKIEEENLRLKTRNMAKDLEFLDRKEKALEDQVFK